MEPFCYRDTTQSFDITYRHTNEPYNTHLFLHNHKDTYEILILLKGNAVFLVEGNEYIPEKWDAIVVNANEMHRMCIPDNTDYERICINITKDFFIQNDCVEFEDLFLKRKLGHDNLVKASPHAKACINRLLELNPSTTPLVMAKSLLIELLFYLCDNSKSVLNTTNQTRINDIITYVNEQLSTPLTLDSIAEHFYLSKYYLCHSFKNATGMSLKRYINYKRLLRARELCSNGARIVDACIEAGFESYSGFYRLYKKEFNTTPKKDIE